MRQLPHLCLLLEALCYWGLPASWAILHTCALTPSIHSMNKHSENGKGNTVLINNILERKIRRMLTSGRVSVPTQQYRPRTAACSGPKSRDLSQMNSPSASASSGKAGFYCCNETLTKSNLRTKVLISSYSGRSSGRDFRAGTQGSNCVEAEKCSPILIVV